MELSERKEQILELILNQPDIGISQILKQLPGGPPVSTVNRDLKALVDGQLLIKSGSGRSTVYAVSPAYRLVHGSLSDSYFDKELDERKGKRRLDPEVFIHLERIDIFTADELVGLNRLQETFQDRIKTLPVEIITAS